MGDILDTHYPQDLVGVSGENDTKAKETFEKCQNRMRCVFLKDESKI